MTSIASELSVLRGQWNVIETQIQLAQVANWYQLCVANPLRWAVLFSFSPVISNQNALAWVTTQHSSPLPGGMVLTNGAPNLELSYRQYGGLVQQQLFGTPGINGCIIQVFEVLAVSGSFFR